LTRFLQFFAFSAYFSTLFSTFRAFSRPPASGQFFDLPRSFRLLITAQFAHRFLRCARRQIAAARSPNDASSSTVNSGRLQTARNEFANRPT
jgi:hypothetical protein